MDNTQLPDEVPECIINWIITFSLAYHKSTNKDISNDAAEYIYDELNMPNALTEYAIKLHKATELIIRMNEMCKGLYHDELANEIKTFLDGK